MALLWKMTCNLTHPVGLRHPVWFHKGVVGSLDERVFALVSLLISGMICVCLKCCRVWQRVAVRRLRNFFRSDSDAPPTLLLLAPNCGAARCSALQRVAARCSALQRVAARCSVLQRVAVHHLHDFLEQCVAVCCSVLQYCNTLEHSATGGAGHHLHDFLEQRFRRTANIATHRSKLYTPVDFDFLYYTESHFPVMGGFPNSTSPTLRPPLSFLDELTPMTVCTNHGCFYPCV